jgi:hypothetical protein
MNSVVLGMFPLMKIIKTTLPPSQQERKFKEFSDIIQRGKFEFTHFGSNYSKGYYYDDLAKLNKI